MNITLWIITIIAGAAYAAGGTTMLLASREKYRSMGKTQHWVDDFGDGHLKAIGTIKLVGAVGLMLPVAVGVVPVLTPLAACGLALFMAGAAWGAPYEQFPESGFDKVYDVNVKGVFLLTRALTPLLNSGATEEDPARVINTGSIDGIVAPGKGRDNFSYSASKAAVHMLTKHLAGELAPRILVNAIAPGLFESRMTKEMLRAGSDAVGSALPLGRIGQPDDIAGISVFLASRASAYITGAVIPVDGGVSTIR